MDVPAVRVPIGIAADRWRTVATERVVLLVVHNLTTLNRLFDVLSLFESDLRVQLVATSSLTDPFSNRLTETMHELGIITIPWEQATQTEFDLIIAASHHGHLTELHGPLVILSHGIGYTKYSPGSREPGAGSREPGAGSREPGAGSREPGAGSR
ncbi:hypothetical protein, partial [Micromonospora aurantiaca (nom. illeg.)]|uniref:hypothetical protein n=1 Tax=Micromonospora aurantiaca (nom. illeg.) TaxID=47850 RepID=UPI00348EB2D6